VQNAFHVHATADAALLAECTRSGTAFVPFFPLGGGLDAGTVRSGAASLEHWCHHGDIAGTLMPLATRVRWGGWGKCDI
jgi:aryl-alcohol dehydrogenase-like predicted oxidoreductase